MASDSAENSHPMKSKDSQNQLPSVSAPEIPPSIPSIPTKSRPHLGDIMSSTQTKAVLLDDRFTPIERIALTCNGNLQRILSAYFNAIVSVDIEKNSPSWDENESVLNLDRVVHLRCAPRTHCCTATSQIQITNKIYQQLVLNDDIGIGQLFRHLNLLPEFKLLEVSQNEITFSRKYVLSSPGIICIITEVFPWNLFREDWTRLDTSNVANSETNKNNLGAINSISTYHVQ